MKHILTRRAVLAAGLGWAASAAIARDDSPIDTIQPEDLNGDWTNAAGKKLTLSVQGTSVTASGGGDWKGEYDADAGTIKLHREAILTDIHRDAGDKPNDATNSEILTLIGTIRVELKVSFEPGTYYTLQLKGTLKRPKLEFNQDAGGSKVHRAAEDEVIPIAYRRVVRTI